MGSKQSTSNSRLYIMTKSNSPRKFSADRKDSSNSLSTDMKEFCRDIKQIKRP